jgi:threonine/homoserine/homoserine lactone efflux protein
MGAIDSMSAGKAFGLGALLSAANPKNLVLCLGGGVAIGGAGLSTADSVVAVAAFVLLSSCTVAVPVVGYLVASRRMQASLDDLRVWLAANNATDGRAPAGDRRRHLRQGAQRSVRRSPGKVPQSG